MTKQRSRAIEAKANELLTAAGALECPVPVERVARHLGLRLEAIELGEDVSGVLVVENNIGSIGYNQAHHPVRQRFTISHEIGHFVLHHSYRSLFIDKQYTAVYKRDAVSSQGDQRFEVEANRFASCLLLPEELVLRAVSTFELDLGNESALKDLADAFAVSMQALSIRLSQMNILPHYS